MSVADSKSYDLLIDLLADLLIEDLAVEGKKERERRSKSISVEINDLTEMV